METILQKKINKQDKILISEIRPPACGNPEKLKAIAKKYAETGCALGVSDNRNGLCMSSLAASYILAQEGIEPIMHMTTRDRNRIALLSDCLGAQSLGINNLLLTSGTHQTLGSFKKAKCVFDIDSIQLTSVLNNINQNADIIGLDKIENTGPFFIGGVADPYADPLDMQIMRIMKKIKAGVKYIITKPVFDLTLFDKWWEKIQAAGIPEKIAIVAGIRILTDSDKVKALSKSRPNPKIPDDLIKQISSIQNKTDTRKEGIKIAIETITELSKKKGIMGFAIDGDSDDDAALQVIDESGLGGT